MKGNISSYKVRLNYSTFGWYIPSNGVHSTKAIRRPSCRQSCRLERNNCDLTDSLFISLHLLENVANVIRRSVKATIITLNDRRSTQRAFYSPKFFYGTSTSAVEVTLMLFLMKLISYSTYSVVKFDLNFMSAPPLITLTHTS